MKKYLFICLCMLVVCTRCSTDEEINRSGLQALTFETFVGKGTRAIVKTGFSDGDNFGVTGYMHDTEAWADGISKTLFMDNVKVTMLDGRWTYSPTEYWEEGVKHTFLAYSPYNENYLVADNFVKGIIIESEAFAQKDLLYAMPETGCKDLIWAEGTKVVMTFRHALSQIKISAYTDQDYSGYYKVRVRKVRLRGVNNSGSLNLNPASDSASPWSEQAATANYVATTGNLDVYLSEAETLLNAGNNLFMLLPQNIASGETATFEITYDIEATEAGNASNAGTGKVAVIKIPVIEWEHNRIYHYKIQMDLQQLLNLKPIEVGEPDVIEWEAGAEAKLPEDLTVTIQPTTSGDTPQTGMGNVTLGITKGNEAGQEQAVKIENPEKDDQWIVEVGPEISDGTDVETRAAATHADWLKIYRQGAAGQEVSKLYGLDDETIIIKITEANSTFVPRKAEITVRRALSGVTRILVTQSKVGDAIIESNSTQFPMVGGENQLTIVNPGIAYTWTLSQSSGSESWLSLKDAGGSAVTSGTNGMSVRAIATPNHTTAVRKATLTLSREGQEPVVVNVTQAAPLPLSVSARSFSFSYQAGSQTLTITNPEAAKSGFLWSLTGTVPSWLTLSQTTGTTDVSGKVTFTVQRNAYTATRSASFVLTRTGQADIPISISQTGAAATTLSKTSLSASYTAGSYTFNVTGPSGLPWALDNSASSWMSLSRTSGDGNATVTISVQAHTDTKATRSGTITLAREGQSNATLTVTQAAAPPKVPSVSSTALYFSRTGGTYYLDIDMENDQAWTAVMSNYTFTSGGRTLPYMGFEGTLGVKTTSGTGPKKLSITVAGNGVGRTVQGQITITPTGKTPIVVYTYWQHNK